MVRTRPARGHNLTEAIVAIGLFVALLPALFPPVTGEVEALREGLETESARLIVEGELERARRDARAGRLEAGARELGASLWTSAERLRGLRLVRRVRPAEAGLWEVGVVASWEGAVPGPEGTERRVALTTLVAREEAP